MSGPEQIFVPAAAQAEQQQGQATGKTAVTTHDGLVVLHFEKPCEYAVYAPLGAVADGTRMLALAAGEDKQAAEAVVQAAMFLIDHVYQVRGDLKPAGGAAKHELIERHRKTLTRRLELVFNSRREQKKTSNAQLAKEAIDIVFHEIFT